MKVNYYSVFEVKNQFPPKTLISFTDKSKAEKHIDLLSESGKTYQLLPIEVNFFLPVAEFTNK